MNKFFKKKFVGIRTEYHELSQPRLFMYGDTPVLFQRKGYYGMRIIDGVQFLIYHQFKMTGDIFLESTNLTRLT